MTHTRAQTKTVTHTHTLTQMSRERSGLCLPEPQGSRKHKRMNTAWVGSMMTGATRFQRSQTAQAISHTHTHSKVAWEKRLVPAGATRFQQTQAHEYRKSMITGAIRFQRSQTPPPTKSQPHGDTLWSNSCVFKPVRKARKNRKLVLEASKKRQKFIPKIIGNDLHENQFLHYFLRENQHAEGPNVQILKSMKIRPGSKPENKIMF